jgi:hypothetical protein
MSKENKLPELDDQEMNLLDEWAKKIYIILKKTEGGQSSKGDKL